MINISFLYVYILNRIAGVMVGMLSSSGGGEGSGHGSVKPKTIQFVFTASPLSTQL